VRSRQHLDGDVRRARGRAAAPELARTRGGPSIMPARRPGVSRMSRAVAAMRWASARSWISSGTISRPATMFGIAMWRTPRTSSVAIA
jgi:hypothetical protein